MSWIKMRTNLRTDGRVRRVARLCDISKAECIGHLFVFWSLADEHSTDGVLKNWDKESVDDETCPGFFNALAEVEWADTTPDGDGGRAFGSRITMGGQPRHGLRERPEPPSTEQGRKP